MRNFFRLVLLLVAASALADPAPFDLTGPTLNLVVTRGAFVLPSSQVPNLAEGDRLWIKAAFPATQSADYLMVAVFLRGSTNPPPEDWFYSCKTWTSRCAHDGLSVTVPAGAQQALVFLAPATNGDMRALVSAVRGRPGAFVRATQDLNQAALDRSRLEAYLSAIHAREGGSPTALRAVAPLLARSLAIKVDDKCLDKIPEMQAACLTQGQESLILNDGQSQSIAQTLTSGPGADLALAASSTPELGFGVYSPYIASVIDIVRILDSFRTAQFQYIPALVSHHGATLALTLNAAPSFYSPKSVLVVALPAIEKGQLPPLHAVDPTEIYCADRHDLVLPVEGAPLAFSTDYAHDITLTLRGDDGRQIRLPTRPDPARGGYVVNTSRLQSAKLGDEVEGALQGYWGFDLFKGPRFKLRNSRDNDWSLATGDEDALVIGRQDTVHLRTDDVSCVDQIMIRDPAGKELKAEWKAVKGDELEVTLPLEHAAPGAMNLVIEQFGRGQPRSVPIRVFASVARFDGFALHAGDSSGVLKGTRLDQVASLAVNGLAFSPGALTTQAGDDQLVMTAQDANAVAALPPNTVVQGNVTLKDGRAIKFSATILPPRPRVTLIGMDVAPSRAGSESHLILTAQNQLPQDARLTFSVRSETPARFGRNESIEIAAADESFSTVLNVANGGLLLADAQVAVATLDPSRAFGASSFGPLKFRPVVDSVAGDWQPLTTLVRLPILSRLRCPTDLRRACLLNGTNLFLIEAVAGDAGFKGGLQVAEGFPGDTLPAPHPASGKLYVKLRDDPSVVNAVLLPVEQVAPPAADASAATLRKADGPTADAGTDTTRKADPPAAEAGTATPRKADPPAESLPAAGPKSGGS